MPLLLLLATAGFAETVDEPTAVRLALAASHPTRAAEARVDAALAGAAAAEAAAWPTVSATAGLAHRSSVPELAAPLGPGEPTVLFPNITSTYAAGLGARQPLYTGGAIAASRAAAASEAAASEADRKRSVDDVRLAARLAYWSAVTSAGALDTAHTQLERAERLVSDSLDLRQAGLAVEADVLAARARAAAARTRLIVAENDAAQAVSNLRSLLGLPAGSELALADRVGSRLPSPPPELGPLTEAAHASRAELAAAAERLATLAARETLALAASKPGLALSAQWELARPNARYMPLEDEWNDSWSVALAAAWTLFDGGQARAQAALLRGQQRALEEERAEIVRRVELEVETAHRQLSTALSAVEAAQSASEAALAREAAVRDRHQAGLATISEQLDADADLAAAELDLLAARAGAFRAAALLDRAVGR